MAEPKYLPVKASAQNLAPAEAKPRESLVGRGLAAIRDGGMLAKQQENDALYRKARRVYECHLPDYDWRQTEHARELQEAFEIFQRLAAEGYGRAYYPLSRFYKLLKSEDLKQCADDYEQMAFKWCMENMTLNEPDIWSDLGGLCYIGNNCEYFLEKSGLHGWPNDEYIDDRWLEYVEDPEFFSRFICLKRAADQGSALAQWELGFLFEDGVCANEAILWYKKAAEQNHADAQNSLGFCYAIGYGVEKNNELAATWHQKAAKQGDAYSQCDIGLMYLHGDGVAKDKEKALKWIFRSVGQGCPYAEYNLGLMYEKGDGVEQDYEKAAVWYRKSAEKGSYGGKYQLKMMLKNGLVR